MRLVERMVRFGDACRNFGSAFNRMIEGERKELVLQEQEREGLVFTEVIDETEEGYLVHPYGSLFRTIFGEVELIPKGDPRIKTVRIRNAVSGIRS